MALGGVSIVPFTTAELTENFGTVSTVPCTRAEITKMFKEKMYPNGKVVWSGYLYSGSQYPSYVSSSISVPNTVDYVTVNGIRLTRGGEARLAATGGSGSARVTFSSSGTLIAYGHAQAGSSGTVITLNINCTGYQYY